MFAAASAAKAECPPAFQTRVFWNDNFQKHPVPRSLQDWLPHVPPVPLLYPRILRCSLSWHRHL